MKIYCLYDKNAKYSKQLDLFENDLVAFREYYLLVERQRVQSQGVFKHEDYKVVCLGNLSFSDDTPLIDSFAYEITEDSIKEYLKEHPTSYFKGDVNGL